MAEWDADEISKRLKKNTEEFLRERCSSPFAINEWMQAFRFAMALELEKLAKGQPCPRYISLTGAPGEICLNCGGGKEDHDG